MGKNGTPKDDEKAKVRKDVSEAVDVGGYCDLECACLQPLFLVHRSQLLRSKRPCINDRKELERESAAAISCR